MESEPTDPETSRPEGSPSEVPPSDLKKKEEVVHTNLHSLKKEAASIKGDLVSVSEKKEEAYSKKEGVTARISALIGKVRELKTKRDSLTTEVRALKDERQKLNADLGEKIAKIKLLYDERDKLGIKAVPETKSDVPVGKIKREIEQLEYKIETDVMPFDKEQKIMKLIKEKKKLIESRTGSNELLAKIGDLSHEIKEAKKKANMVHKDIQTKASESQRLHEELITISKDIDKLKEDEKEAYDAFMEAKKEYAEVNSKLREKSANISDTHGKLASINTERRKERKRQEDKIIEEKQLAVSEKIKKGMKLTTDDLLMFQKENSEEGFLKELEEEGKKKK